MSQPSKLSSLNSVLTPTRLRSSSSAPSEPSQNCSSTLNVATPFSKFHFCCRYLKLFNFFATHELTYILTSFLVCVFCLSLGLSLFEIAGVFWWGPEKLARSSPTILLTMLLHWQLESAFNFWRWISVFNLYFQLLGDRRQFLVGIEINILY